MGLFIAFGFLFAMGGISLLDHEEVSDESDLRDDGANDEELPIEISGLSLFGSDESEEISGTIEGDLLAGGGGDDTLKAAAGDDYVVTFDGGTDLAYGGKGDDTIFADDLMELSEGNSFIDSEGNADSLFGGSGNDHIELADSDWAKGGKGSDEFSVGWSSSSNEPVVISDFRAESDVIEIVLPALDTNLAPVSQDPADWEVTLKSVDNGTGTQVLLNGSVTAYLPGCAEIAPDMVNLRFA